MAIAATAIFLASAIATLPEAQLCQLMQKNVRSYEGQSIGPMTVNAAAADCRRRRILLRSAVDARDEQRQRYLAAFMQAARQGVCSQDETMAAFRARGWKFEYAFRFVDGVEEVQTLTC